MSEGVHRQSAETQRTQKQEKPRRRWLPPPFSSLFPSLDVPPEARHSLRWDVLAGASVGVFMGMTFPFFIKIARGELGASQSAIALMIAAPFIGNLFSPLWARQMEGRDKLPFCLASWIIARSLLFLMPLSEFPGGFRVAAFGGFFVAVVSAMQIIGTISSPAYTSLMRDIYPDSARGCLMGYVRVVMQLLMFVTTLVTGRLLDAGVSYRYLFPIAGLFGIGAALAFRHVRPFAPEKPMSETKPLASAESASPSVVQFLRQTISILKHNVAYRWFALSVFIYGFANLMVQPLYGLYQVDVLHIRSTEIANLANVSSLCAIVGSFFWGRFMDRNGPAMTVMCSISLISFIPIVYLTTHSVTGLFLAAILAGIGFSGVELSYLASILLYAERERTAQYQSLHSLLLGIRGVIAPLLGVPLVAAFGYPAVFLGALFVMLFGAFLQALAIRAGVAKSKA